MKLFSEGQYLHAAEERAMADAISQVLYPEDNHYEGKSLRLKQQYFFVSATIQSITRKHIQQYGTLRNFHEKNVIQINDTHPTLVIPELMRILIDDAGMGWDEAWHITTHCVAYTNHTVPSEALEVWPQSCSKRCCPVCGRYCRRFPPLAAASGGILSRPGQDRQAGHYLGRRRPHGQPVHRRQHGCQRRQRPTLRDFAEGPVQGSLPDDAGQVQERHQRHRPPPLVPQINPGLDGLLRDLDRRGLSHPSAELKKLEAYAGDKAVLQRLEDIKHQNKLAFAAFARKHQGVVLNTDAILDVQVKRLHEYKRQLLNAMQIIYAVQRLQDDPRMSPTAPDASCSPPRLRPGYAMAKRIIHLQSRWPPNERRPRCAGRLQVVFGQLPRLPGRDADARREVSGRSRPPARRRAAPAT